MRNKILALLLALCMVMTLLPAMAFAGDDDSNGGGDTNPTVTEEPTNTPEPTETEEPTNTPKPTETEAPDPDKTQAPDPTGSENPDPSASPSQPSTGNGDDDLDENHCRCNEPGCTAASHVGGEDGTLCVTVVENGLLCDACKAYAAGESATPSAEPSAAPSAVPSAAPVTTTDTPKKAEDFSDVPAGMWYNDDLTTMLEKGWFIGQTGGTFAPQSATTGAEVVVILSRVLGQDLVTTGSAWSAAATDWAAETGLTEGIAISTTGGLARQDLILMLWRAANKPESSYALSFTDIGSVSGDALTALKWAVEKGIVKGNGDGTVSPNGATKRCEMAALMVRYDAAVNG